MSGLKLIIPEFSDTGIFDTKIVSEENKFEQSLSQYFKFSNKLPHDFFANTTELAIFYGDTPITVPLDIAKNLLKYLRDYKIYNINTEFTCHQFATLLITGRCKFNYTDTLSSATKPHLSPGDVVRFVNQTGQLGDQVNISLVHSAVYLGNGLYFSKNARKYPVICTLEAILAIYPCDYMTVVTDTHIHGEIVYSNLSMHTSFKNKSYVKNGLAYRALNTESADFLKISPQKIATLSRRALAKFHPDRTTLPLDQAARFFSMTKKISELLIDPIKRSEYNVSLLAGRDWSIQRILNLYNDGDKSVIETFESYIKLLKFHEQLEPDEEIKIKTDPVFRAASAPADMPENDDVIVHISNDVARIDNQDPYHPTSILFNGQVQKLEINPHFTRTSQTRIGDLKIYFGTPICIPFNQKKFKDKTLQIEALLEEFPPGLFTYPDINLALEILELWRLRDTTIQLNLTGKLGMKQLTHWHPNSLVLLQNRFQSNTCKVAVYLGGNFYLYDLNPAADSLYIVNTAFLQTQNVLSCLLPLLGSAQEVLQRYSQSKNINFIETESFPLLAHEQAERLKRRLLTSSSKEDDFIPDLYGFKLKNESIKYDYNPSYKQYIIRPGESILLCKNTQIIVNAFHLGNYLFALISADNQLRILNLLMLAETADWDQLFVMQPIKAESKGHHSCEILLHRKKILFENIKQPLLYEILDIPFDLTHLSNINESVVIEYYQKRLSNEKNPDVIHVLNRAYKLLMNDYYRVLYGTEVLFGGEPEFNVAVLLNFNKNTASSDVVKGYVACLTLIKNKELKERVSKEYLFTQAQTKLTIDYIDTLPLGSANGGNLLFGCERWSMFRGDFPQADWILSHFPEAQTAFTAVEEKFELKKISLNTLPLMSIDRLLEHIWCATHPNPPNEKPSLPASSLPGLFRPKPTSYDTESDDGIFKRAFYSQ